ncbi:MAG TPA: winged helix-turn-helix domain-containing protein [Prolixibacteraceae bacterium]|nr:winged helix-turn-helix domain-containing protein [Prolixibacteraceae bacterium]
MIEVECHISVKKDGTCFLSPVKTELLNEIRQSGSLSGAAKKLKISYQHAWTMIEEMNRSAPEPLVIKQRGGANGGGAEISAYGEKILKEYRIIEAQVKKLVDQINVEINF